MLRLELPFPDADLWPNGRSHHMAKARKVSKAREYAYWLALSKKDDFQRGEGLIAVHLTVNPKPRDNASAAAKAFLDGIAQAIGIDDRHFASPVVTIGERKPGGGFVLEIGA